MSRTKSLGIVHPSPFNQAIPTVIGGDTLRVLGPGPRLLLAMVQHRLGETDAARKTFDVAIAGYDWDPAKVTNRESWMFHLLRREAEATIPSEPQSAAANDQSVISKAP